MVKASSSKFSEGGKCSDKPTLDEETEGNIDVVKLLDTFTSARALEGFILQIEDEEGKMLEIVASYDQLELIAEEIERDLDLAESDEDGALMMNSPMKRRIKP